MLAATLFACFGLGVCCGFVVCSLLIPQGVELP